MRTLTKRFLMWLWGQQILADAELGFLIQFIELGDA